MQILELAVAAINPARWNPNEMDEAMHMRLRRSIERFSLVLPLVVRRVGEGQFETIGGAQRLVVMKELGMTTAPCVVVEADDAEARLLSQALNHIAGQDNLGLRAELLRQVLEAIPEQEVLEVLPETASSLTSLAAMGQQEIAEQLKKWQQAQAARLRHLQFQLTPVQLQVVEKAVARVLTRAKQARGDSPNLRGTALFLICQEYLKREGV